MSLVFRFLINFLLGCHFTSCTQELSFLNNLSFLLKIIPLTHKTTQKVLVYTWEFWTISQTFAQYYCIRVWIRLHIFWLIWLVTKHLYLRIKSVIQCIILIILIVLILWQPDVPREIFKCVGKAQGIIMSITIPQSWCMNDQCREQRLWLLSQLSRVQIPYDPV